MSISSIEPIRNAVASRDQALLEAVLELDDDDPVLTREIAESMIMCSSPPEEEQGEWWYVIELLAEHFGLEPESLPGDDWKHLMVWDRYCDGTATHITQESRQYLTYLARGRPLQGKVVGGGDIFAWIAAAEVEHLHGDLSALDSGLFAGEDLEDFHEELVKALHLTKERNAVLLMSAY